MRMRTQTQTRTRTRTRTQTQTQTPGPLSLREARRGSARASSARARSRAGAREATPPHRAREERRGRRVELRVARGAAEDRAGRFDRAGALAAGELGAELARAARAANPRRGVGARDVLLHRVVGGRPEIAQRAERCVAPDVAEGAHGVASQERLGIGARRFGERRDVARGAARSGRVDRGADRGATDERRGVDERLRARRVVVLAHEPARPHRAPRVDRVPREVSRVARGHRVCVGARERCLAPRLVVRLGASGERVVDLGRARSHVAHPRARLPFVLRVREIPRDDRASDARGLAVRERPGLLARGDRRLQRRRVAALRRAHRRRRRAGNERQRERSGGDDWRRAHASHVHHIAPCEASSWC